MKHFCLIAACREWNLLMQTIWREVSILFQFSTQNVVLSLKNFNQFLKPLQDHHVIVSGIYIHHMLVLSYKVEIPSLPAMLGWFICLLFWSQVASISSLLGFIAWFYSLVCFYFLWGTIFLPVLQRVVLWRTSNHL